jgi:predicted amidohydrolase YtcJ
VVLDIFEELLTDKNVSEHRPRIEHTQIITPDDVERLSRLGGEAA